MKLISLSRELIRALPVQLSHLAGLLTKKQPKSKKAKSLPSEITRSVKTSPENIRKLSPAQTSAPHPDNPGVLNKNTVSKSNPAITERARCAKIIAHGLKNGCVNQAYTLAFDTLMTADQSITALIAAKLDSAHPGFGQRTSMMGFAKDGADSPPLVDRINPQASAKAIANQVVAVAAQVRGKRYETHETIGAEMGRAQRTHAGSAAAIVSTAAKAAGEMFNSTGDRDDFII